jgi:hypothetical protein
VNRREFITLLGGAAVWPVGARAQRMARVGYLGLVRSASTYHRCCTR